MREPKGSALLLTILILTGILSISFGVADLIMSGTKASRHQVRSGTAFYAAEAGTERILWEIRKNEFDYSGCSAGNYLNFSVSPAVCVPTVTSYSLPNLNGTDYRVVYNKIGGLIYFKSIGDYLGDRRAVEISFAE